MDTIKLAAEKFANDWQNHGYEKGEAQKFWLALLFRVFNIPEADQFIQFENSITLYKYQEKQKKQTGFIDGYIPSTKVMIEQKGIDISLDKEGNQSDGSKLTPFMQAKRYWDELDLNKKPRWIVVSNFKEFQVYDMNAYQSGKGPEIIKLEDLPTEYYRLEFLVNPEKEHIEKEMRLSLEAGEIIGRLYDEILKHYLHPESPETLRSLNILCTRLVFCLYAEDANLFGSRNLFHDYLKPYPAKQLREALINLFKVLDTPENKRDPYLADDLAVFPYVNGGLFADETIEIPKFDDQIKELLLAKASNDFDWSDISPTIFGSLFESTLNQETRRNGGMHYTHWKNIHKVIDPLFLDDLKNELAQIKATPVIATQKKKLLAFQDKLASLTFLDPACGSGNFLTETYLSLRQLENEVLECLFKGQMQLDVGHDLIKVSIHQFYGIEINDFAVAVATTALWIAESQMFHMTEKIMHSSMDFLPLKSYSNIVEGNALRIDWNQVISKDKLNYIIGNPPFVGARLMSTEQKQDVLSVFGQRWQNIGNLDYVGCWYKKAAEMMQETSIRTALVATNSICQGGQVSDLWKGLIQQYGIHNDFAHRTFRWDSEANLKAHVHCVIVGFSAAPTHKELRLFENDSVTAAKHINPYLIDAEDMFIDSRSTPICSVPEIGIGNQPIDDGNYLFLPEEKEAFIKQEPTSEKYFRPWYGAQEFINNKPRWCLWLGDCSPAELHTMPHCLERVLNVKKFRLKSNRGSTKKLAVKPTRFQTENMPEGTYIVVARVSSENRLYVPMGYLSSEALCSDATLLIPQTTLYHFGVLTSLIHNAWIRVVCGRLKSDYRYSKDIVYNNFPWPEPTEQQRALIERTAQEILDARAKYPNDSLADLYDPLTMPAELRQAHHHNDHVVAAAYGFSNALSEQEIVAELFKRYKQLTEQN